ncbi:PfkB family carbohydrate kinase [Halobaculum limi]|uniref:PfkB family carbohydrate kinase n=1 Tax=Halobaculum limi TaxID=3031916 RepID=UPI0024059350|nr:PfkB family carbohydrate kinase [Halobaculum sp. YSMS11]
MGTVCSLGSINVDRVHLPTTAELQTLEQRYDWFPSRGQTVAVETIPSEFPSPDQIEHGGKGANQAVAAAAMGADVALFGKYGPDAEKFGVRNELKRAGVSVDAIGVAASKTGSAHVFVDPAGDNRIVITAGANGDVDREYVLHHYDRLVDADCLLLQNEIPVDPVTSLLQRFETEQNPPCVILDPSPVAGVRPLIDCPVIKYLTPNESEYRELQDALTSFEGTVLRTVGSDGVIVGDEVVSTPPVDPVDTTGAGDVFNGVFAAGRASGATLRAAVETATIAASLSTEGEGARGRIPTPEEVQAIRSR